MKPKRIGIDLDSTLNHLDRAWRDWIKKHHDPEFALEKWLSWDVHHHAAGGSKIYDFLVEPGAYINLEVQADAVRVTERLVTAGHEVYVVTAYKPESCLEKCQWIAKHFPHIHHENIIFCWKKNLLNLDLLIDDGPHNAVGVAGNFLLYEQPWNASATDLKYRAKGWWKVEQWLEDARYL